LLEKVHNFGHILRTLHGHNALLVVPSETPLHHPECKELVPLNSDVPIVEIRQKDLHKFIILMKSLGYPMVALEQCSRSVQVESAVFPDKFMLLLGNERLGAPGWLLNEGDLLV
jgi:tRNA G18 (ribose-2'-O)-methylase SpoU